MKKIELKDIKIKRGLEKTNNSYIFELDNNQILKVYDDNLLFILDLVGLDLEKRIVNAKEIENVKEILIPNSAVYCDNSFVGYIMEKAKGINYNDYEERTSIHDRENLQRYIQNQLKLEDIIKRANKENIVFPDLLTCDNIFVHNNNYSFIDYDGIQIGNNNVFEISSSLGDQTQYYNSKYMKNDKLFTEQLDKKSLIILFFLTAFNVNLEKIGTINPYTGEYISLDYIFNIIGLDDYDIMNKVWKLYQNKEKNEFLGNSLHNLTEKYNLKIIGQTNNRNCYLKRLIKK